MGNVRLLVSRIHPRCSSAAQQSTTVRPTACTSSRPRARCAQTGEGDGDGDNAFKYIFPGHQLGLVLTDNSPFQPCSVGREIRRRTAPGSTSNRFESSSGRGVHPGKHARLPKKPYTFTCTLGGGVASSLALSPREANGPLMLPVTCKWWFVTRLGPFQFSLKLTPTSRLLFLASAVARESNL